MSAKAEKEKVLDLNAAQRYHCPMCKPLTTAQLQKIIAGWDDGSGVTAAVQVFAAALPVAERTV